MKKIIENTEENIETIENKEIKYNWLISLSSHIGGVSNKYIVAGEELKKEEIEIFQKIIFIKRLNKID